MIGNKSSKRGKRVLGSVAITFALIATQAQAIEVDLTPFGYVSQQMRAAELEYRSARAATAGAVKESSNARADAHDMHQSHPAARKESGLRTRTSAAGIDNGSKANSNARHGSN